MNRRIYAVGGFAETREHTERTLAGMRRDYAIAAGQCQADIGAAIEHMEAVLAGRIAVNPRLWGQRPGTYR